MSIEAFNKINELFKSYTTDKEIIILFGEMGAGKNYWGEILAREPKLSFFDGDSIASSEMIERVSKFKFYQEV